MLDEANASLLSPLSAAERDVLADMLSRIRASLVEQIENFKAENGQDTQA